MLLLIRLFYASLKAVFALIVLVLWEIFFLLMFTLVIMVSILSYCLWLPCLTFRASYEYLEYRIPFRQTWESEYYLGHKYNPENTFKRNAKSLLLEPISSVYWRIGIGYQKALIA